jgi:succinate dehydrogenase / fumarate reductase, flavoprotein subunit
MRVVIYGGGVAALASALALARDGVEVELVGPTEPAAWPALAEGGVAVAEDPEAHALATLRCGAFAAPRAPVRALSRAAAGIVAELGRAGVAFAGELRRMPGMRAPGAAHAGGATDQAIAHALDRALLSFVGTRVALREPFELCALALADGRAAGIVAQNLETLELEAFGADAVLLCCGGIERVLSGCPSGLTGEGPLAIAARAGAHLVDVDVAQHHPATFTTPRGVIAPTPALRAEGARLWVPAKAKEERPAFEVPHKERLRFLAERFPGWEELAPDDLAAAETRAVIRERGVWNRLTDTRERLCFLDVSHLPERHLRARIGRELDACAVATGTDPYGGPLRATPAALGLLGGLWVDFARGDDGGLVAGDARNHATSIPGLYAAGPIASLYHGVCRLGGNGLLADLFGARIACEALRAFVAAEGACDEPAALDAASSDAEAELVAEGDEESVGDAEKKLFRAAQRLWQRGDPGDLDVEATSRDPLRVRSFEQMRWLARAAAFAAEKRDGAGRVRTRSAGDGFELVSAAPVAEDGIAADERRYEERA